MKQYIADFFKEPEIPKISRKMWTLGKKLKMHPGSYKFAHTPLTMLRIDCACWKKPETSFSWSKNQVLIRCKSRFCSIWRFSSRFGSTHRLSIAPIDADRCVLPGYKFSWQSDTSIPFPEKCSEFCQIGAPIRSRPVQFTFFGSEKYRSRPVQFPVFRSDRVQTRLQYSLFFYPKRGLRTGWYYSLKLV